MLHLKLRNWLKYSGHLAGFSVSNPFSDIEIPCLLQAFFCYPVFCCDNGMPESEKVIRKIF